VPPPPSRRREIRSTAANAAVIRHTAAAQQHEKRDQWMTRSIKRSQGFAAEEFLVSDTTLSDPGRKIGEEFAELGEEVKVESSREGPDCLYSIYCICLH
jgi:hypothetical protein